jgi:hypothetical protein
MDATNSVQGMVTMMTHGDIVQRVVTHLANRYDVVLGEPVLGFPCELDMKKAMGTMKHRNPDVVAFRGYMPSTYVAVECKASRSDYRADAKKRDVPQAGTDRYYACPADLIAVDELPERWGLMYVTNNGVRIVKHAVSITDGVIPASFWACHALRNIVVLSEQGYVIKGRNMRVALSDRRVYKQLAVFNKTEDTLP